MKKIFLFILFFFLLFNTSIAKESIYNLINNNNKCGQTQIFNSYFITYSRLINEKDLTEKNITDIKYYLSSAFNIVNKNNICSIDDLSKLNDKEKNKIFDYLTNGLKIINNAKSLYNEEETKSDSSNIIIDRETKSINIYDSNTLVNKIPFNEQKLTYTGPNKYIIFYIITFILLSFILLKYKKTKKIYFDFLYSFCLSFIVILTMFLLFKNEFKIINNVVNLLKKVETINNRDIILDEDNNIKVYPGYGDLYGMLLIPELNITNNIVFGDSIDILKNNIGHYTSSNLPGENKTIIYSGHNKKEILKNMSDIKIDNEILIKTTYGEFKYKVYDIKIINDTDWDKILITNEFETLIIYTCYPFSNIFYGSKRFVVYSKLIEEEWIKGELND